jgi:hypothetical protein
MSKGMQGSSDRYGPRARRSWRTTAGAVLTATCASAALLVSASPAGAAAPSVSATIQTSNATPQTGQPFDITINYRCFSVVVDCLGAVITETLPANLDPAYNLVTSPHVQSYSYTAATRQVKWTMISPLKAGSTGAVGFTTSFTQGPTANGATAAMKASFTTTNGEIGRAHV